MKLPYDQFCHLFCWSVGFSVGLSDIISCKGGKFHFHTPILFFDEPKLHLTIYYYLSYWFFLLFQIWFRWITLRIDGRPPRSTFPRYHNHQATNLAPLTITLFLSTTSPSHHHHHPPFRPFRLGLLVKWNKHNELTTTRLYLSSLSSQHPVRGARARGHRFLSYRNGFRDMERDQRTRSDETADSKGKSTTIVKTVASGGRVCNQCTSSCRWGLWF